MQIRLACTWAPVWLCKKYWLFGWACLFMSIKAGLAQDSTVAVLRQQFIPDSVMRQLVKEELWKLAKPAQVLQLPFNTRFGGGYPHLWQTLQPQVDEALANLVARNPAWQQAKPGTPTYKAAQQAFAATVRNTVKAGVMASVELRRFVAPDFSDRILIFHSDIQVLQDGGMLVEETITIYNGNGNTGIGYDEAVYPASINNDIKRGIVRDFPTIYYAKDGWMKTVGFELQAVTKNGQPEPYLTERLDNGTRIMVGQRDVLIDKGIYTYTLSYKTTRQLIFHKDKDELYWNVNGNGWVFTADSISCHIKFPPGAVIKEANCYTGYSGSTEKYCAYNIISPNEISFSGQRNFEAYQGLTVAAAIEKGFLQAPTGNALLLQKAKDNFMVPLLALLLLFMVVYYAIIWSRYGKDPQRGTIIPQFEPPAGISPADAGYILAQKYQPRFFAAALVDFAVHKALIIEVSREGWLVKQTVYKFKQPPLTKPPHYAEANSFYGFSPASFYNQEIKSGTYNAAIGSLNTKLKAQLEKRVHQRKGQRNSLAAMFRLNSWHKALPILLLIAAAIASFMYMVNYGAWQMLGWLGGLWLAALVVFIIFNRIMPAYTVQGRAVADQLEGFKMYLETAEQRLFEYFTPPTKTLELFEKYLPYAIALGVDNAWAKKFDSIIQKALAEGYKPGYYSGSSSHQSLGRSFSSSNFSQSLSAGLSSTISSASTPPSSSSGGSGGGGSSGGGGGGGGGGGW